VECLAKRKSILGDSHPDTLISINNLAGLYKNQGKKFDLAEPLCLGKRKSIFGDSTPFMHGGDNRIQSNINKYQPTFLRGHHSKILCLAASEKWGFLFSGSENAEIIVWRLESIVTKKQQITDHNGAVNCLATFEDLLYSGSCDRSVVIRNIAENFKTMSVIHFRSQVISLALANDGNFLYVRESHSYNIKVWNCVNGNHEDDIRDRNNFREVVVFENLKLLSNSCRNRTAKYWNMMDGQAPYNPVDLPRGREDFQRSIMTSLAVRNDIFCASFQNEIINRIENEFSVRLWDINNDIALVEIPDLHTCAIKCLAISDSNRVFSG
jgi:WD40 repeat protein